MKEHTVIFLAGWRFKALLGSIALAALGYLGFALWSGWDEVWRAVRLVGWSGVGLALLLSLVNYGLRFLRWQMYLAGFGHRLPVLLSGRIYLAGFALTTTPGKAGEALRSLFLKPLGVAYPQSIAAFLSERLADLSAILLLALFGLSLYPQAHWLVWAGGAIVAGFLILLAQDSLLARGHAATARAAGRLPRLLHHLLHVLREARNCHAPRKLPLVLALSVLAWSAEAYALYLILHLLGAEVSPTFAFFVYAVSMLAGALSFLPGGLGGTEAVMIALLLWAGVPQPSAVAATVLIRLATLWFAVGLGVAALLLSQAAGQETEKATT